MRITNCHIHVFTSDSIPDNFVPYIGWLVKYKYVRAPLRFLLRLVNPFSGRDKAHRMARFLNISYKETQREIFEIIQTYYPSNTRYIVLPMDMQFMGAGNIQKSWLEQHMELVKLTEEFPDRIIPFIAVDPNREGLLDSVKQLVEEHNFRGIKIYPPLGFYPFDERLNPVYSYAQANNIPVMAHCSRGGIYARKKISEEMRKHPQTGKLNTAKDKDVFSDCYADPDNYKSVLTKFPELRICLAHFGGTKDWDTFLYPHLIKEENNGVSWFSKILDMIRSGDYPNLYTDVSYTILEDEHYMHVLKVILSNPAVLKKTLFGSDFYMVEQEKMEERKLVIKLRSILGEDFFKTIAEENPVAYLGEK